MTTLIFLVIAAMTPEGNWKEVSRDQVPSMQACAAQVDKATHAVIADQKATLILSCSTVLVPGQNS